MKKSLFILMMFLQTAGYGQDMLSSQYQFNPMTINPALAGGDVRFRLVTQTSKPWLAVPTSMWKNTIAADMLVFPFDREDRTNFKQRLVVGAGLMYESITQGYGTFTAHQPSLAVSGKVYLDDAVQYTWISVGYQLSYHALTQDWSRYTFSDQLDPDLGKISGMTSLPLETYVNRDFSGAMGVVSQFRLGNKHNPKFPTYLRMGLAVYNLGRFESSYAVSNRNNEFPRRYSGFAKLDLPVKAINFTDATFLSVYGKFDLQSRSFIDRPQGGPGGAYRDLQFAAIVNHENKRPGSGYFSFIWGFGTKSTWSAFAKHNWLNFIGGVSHTMGSNWDIQYSLAYAPAITTPFRNAVLRSNFGTVDLSILLRFDKVRCDAHRRDDSWL